MTLQNNKWNHSPKDIRNNFTSEISGEFDWLYASDRQRIKKLYSQGKQYNWDAEKDINWDTPILPKSKTIPRNFTCEWSGHTQFENLTEKQKLLFLQEHHAWGINQTLHGEQGALLVASQLVSSEAEVQAKMYAASQTFDEARHVEVFKRYIEERERIYYPITPPLEKIITNLLESNHWDIKLLGMQLIIENVALVNFNQMKKSVFDPTLQQILTYVIQDEARHVSYGIDQLSNAYEKMGTQDRSLRFKFVTNTLDLLFDSLMPYEVWEKFSWDSDAAYNFFINSHRVASFTNILSQRIFPHMSRINLLTPEDKETFSKILTDSNVSSTIEKLTRNHLSNPATA